MGTRQLPGSPAHLILIKFVGGTKFRGKADAGKEGHPPQKNGLAGKVNFTGVSSAFAK